MRISAGSCDKARERRIAQQVLSRPEVCAEVGTQWPRMEVLRRSSVFAAEVMEVFDRSPTDKELVSQAKALCRDYINSRLIRAGVSWSKAEPGTLVPGGKLAEVSTILLRLGESLRPGGAIQTWNWWVPRGFSCDDTEDFILCY